MPSLARIASVLLVAVALHAPALADDTRSASRSQTLVPFGSAEGLDRLARSNAKTDFAPLANQFEAQATIAFAARLRRPSSLTPWRRTELRRRVIAAAYSRWTAVTFPAGWS